MSLLVAIRSSDPFLTTKRVIEIESISRNGTSEI